MKILPILLFCALVGQNKGQSVDVGRAKAKISVEEMLKLHRKRRDDDKLFSINSPRRSENKQVSIIFSIFYMQHPNVFAHGDVSVLRAICALYGKDIVEDARRLNDHIEKWSPFNSIACMMMWNWVDNQIKN